MDRGSRLLGPLGRRLFAAFTLTAVGAVALVALLAVLSVRQQTGSAVAAQQARQRDDLVAALADAYRRAGNTWQGADLTGVQALARTDGARVVLLDTGAGQVTDLMPSHMAGHDGASDNADDHGNAPHATATAGNQMPGGQMPGGHRDDHATAAPSPSPAATTATPSAAAGTGASPAPAAGTSTVPIVVDGQRVGSLLFDPAPASSTATWQARAAVLRTVGTGALLAVALAALVALLASRRISGPLVGLAAATRAVEHGDLDASPPGRPGPGEVGQLSRAFTRMARALRREDQLRRAVLADVAHELRTPVTILRGQTEQILDGLAEPDRDHLTSLHEETLRLERLVGDLATLAAAQAAGLTLHRQPLDLAQLTARVAGSLRHQCSEAGLTLRQHLEPVRVDGDPDRLDQVVTNLLGNAIKYTPTGGTVTVETGRAGDRAVLTVSDTGPGIPAAERPHVFDRFWRGPAATTRAGTGIGLAVVAELTAAHNGTATVDAAPAGGARFTIRLPAT